MAGGIENLKPWKPGQSGNPAGRPKKANPFAAHLREDDRLKALIENLYNKATAGDIASIKEMLDRAYGRPAQTTISLSEGDDEIEAMALTPEQLAMKERRDDRLRQEGYEKAKTELEKK